MWVKGSQKVECGLFGLRGLISQAFVSDASGILSRDGDGRTGRIAQVRPFAISQ
jgi:hypothetical protein